MAKAMLLRVNAHLPWGEESDSLAIYGTLTGAMEGIKYLLTELCDGKPFGGRFVASATDIDLRDAVETYEVLCLDCKTRVRPGAFPRHMKTRHNVELELGHESTTEGMDP